MQHIVTSNLHNCNALGKDAGTIILRRDDLGIGILRDNAAFRGIAYAGVDPDRLRCLPVHAKVESRAQVAQFEVFVATDVVGGKLHVVEPEPLDCDELSAIILIPDSSSRLSSAYMSDSEHCHILAHSKSHKNRHR